MSILEDISTKGEMCVIVDDIKVYRVKKGRYYNTSTCMKDIIQHLHYNYSSISQDRIRKALEYHVPCVIDMGDGTLWQIQYVPDPLNPRSYIVEFGELKKVED